MHESERMSSERKSSERKSLNDEQLSAAGDVCDTSEPLLPAFFQTSAIGFAVLDKQLRYQAMNNCLANINGLPAQAHMGVTVDEIFGELSEIAKPSYHRALADGESSQFEVANAVLLPDRSLATGDSMPIFPSEIALEQSAK